MIHPTDYEIEVKETVLLVKKGLMITVSRLPRNTTRQQVAEVAVEAFISSFALDTPDECGGYCGSACWYKPETRELREDGTWECLDPECSGTLTANGTLWPTGDPGIHHACNLCRLRVAVPESILLKEER